MGYLLAAVGFNSAAEVQNSSVLTMMVFCEVVLPAIISVVATVIMKVFYPLGKKELQEQYELLKNKKEIHDAPLDWNYLEERLLSVRDVCLVDFQMSELYSLREYYIRNYYVQIDVRAGDKLKVIEIYVPVLKNGEWTEE